MTKKIKYISDTEAQVTKAFKKKAVIFGTEEYKLWREYKRDFPNAEMVTKTINRNPDKKTNRNMKYDNMRKYIKANSKDEKEEEERIAEFDRQLAITCIMPSPYHEMVKWFKNTYKVDELPNSDEKNNKPVENNNESVETVEAE